MKKKTTKTEEEEEEEDLDERGLEIVKAVAQAWYSRAEASRRTTNEFDARKRRFGRGPTRFHREASRGRSPGPQGWDFGQSLWDSYEIVAVSRRIETGLAFDQGDIVVDGLGKVERRRRESKNSLRSLFGLVSRRFDFDQARNIHRDSNGDL